VEREDQHECRSSKLNHENCIIKIELNGKREGKKDQANLKAFILFFYKSFKVLTKKWFKDGNTTNVDH